MHLPTTTIKALVHLSLIFVVCSPKKLYTIRQHTCNPGEIARWPCFSCFGTAVESDGRTSDDTPNSEYLAELIIPIGESDFRLSGAQLREYAATLQTMSFGDEEKHAVQDLINMLIDEVGDEIQGEHDLWLASEAWNAAELLYADPSRFIQSPYTAEETENGMETSFEVPYWVVDSKAALRIVCRKLFEEILGISWSEGLETVHENGYLLPRAFSRDANGHRLIKFEVGDVSVLIRPGVSKEGLTTVGIVNDPYAFSVGSNVKYAKFDFDQGTISSATVIPVSSPGWEHSIKLEDLSVNMRNKVDKKDNALSFFAEKEAFNVKVHADRQAREHSAAVGDQRFNVGLSRNFNNEVGIFTDRAWHQIIQNSLPVKRLDGQFDGYRIEAQQDLEDTSSNATSAALLLQSPSDEYLRLSSGFDASNTMVSDMDVAGPDYSLGLKSKAAEAALRVTLGEFTYLITFPEGEPLPNIVLDKSNNTAKMHK